MLSTPFRTIWRALSHPQRAFAVIFLVCLVNAFWSLAGTWSIVFGGEHYKHFDSASHRSGVYSCRGFLILSIRDSSFMGAGMRPPNADTLSPIRQRIRWSVQAELYVDPQMSRILLRNGILDDRPRSLIPGLLLVNWQPATSHPWYNRGIAIHWALLTILFGTWPIVSGLRAHRGATRNQCLRCGYDLRATPERCPECGMAA